MTATAPPIVRLRGVGCASHAVAAPRTNPSGTRSRAIRFSRSLDIPGPVRGRRNPDDALNRGRDFRDRDLRQTPPGLMAAPLVVAAALGVAGHGGVAAPPRTVPRRISGAEDPDDRCAGRGGDMK